MIKLKGINKYYSSGEEKLHALKDVDLDVAKGEFLAIMGPSGSGKSTMIKILGLLDKEFQGSYFLDEKEVKTLNDDLLSNLRNEKIGFVFQDFNLIDRLTIKENIELPMLYMGRGIKETKDKVKELLEKVKLLDKIDKYPKQLSGGQQQRISIVRSLVNNPDIIIADEPTGALDSKTSEEIIEIFNKLNKEGITIILITHDINVAKKAKRIVKIFDGQLKEVDNNEI
ncbi:ABC transporter ATP-binding protein [Clostridium tertium]|jgi:putative ABC transport system ATP-binding protein|uniref:ABC transporter ATP-binding protein n=1 Tax=Clostridium tertium TaxID=1559 RepID=A0A9X4AYK6_9CLOT|nr:MULTISPECIES: ABC transporter ATP-binding protein [Clostridium]MBP1867333.1 putative ABC transport system ATP-binding protein [Clostridium tertium]MBS5883936.1 ABC transporter ATP-binding protein [Clostridium sp.]MBU6134765.1 ABC transporter ATP-binding protein [Clostridium tertium]MDB1940221.1 ABC transporter ATP-binding protein [Clostridium tertium]MDB1948157.1 ABC transporter ATP-binding protein [Clostridium tertium]